MSLASQRIIDSYRIPHIAIYTRVSTEEQAKNGESLGVQEQLCLDLCRQRFGDNLFTYEVISDPGKSGSLGPIPNDPRSCKRKRKGLEQLILGLQGKKYTHVCAYKSDRLYRKVLGWFRFRELCEEVSAELFFVAEKFETNIGGRFASDIVAHVAEFIRQQTADNVQDSLDARKRDGYWTGTPPFGWRYQTEEEAAGERPSIVHLPERVDVVRRIDRMFVEGRSFQEIARILNAEQVPQRRAIGRWEATTVSNALMNHGHAGLVRSKSGELVRGRHYDLRFWDQAHHELLQEVVRRRRKKFKGVAATQPSRLFAGLARCGVCGKKLRSEFACDNPCYRCLGQRGKEAHVYVSAKFLQAAVLGEIRAFAARPDVLEAATTEILSLVEGETASLGSERESVQKKLSHIRWKRSNLLDALTSAVISQEDYREKASEFEEEFAELSKRCDQLTSQLKAISSSTYLRETALTKLKDFNAIWDALEDHERRELIHAVIEKLEICLEGERLFLRLKLTGLPESEVPVQRGRSKWRPTKAIGPEGLTLRELAFLKHILDGLKMSAIAEIMDIRIEHAYRLGDRAKRQLGLETYAHAAEASKHVINLHMSVLPLYGKKNRAMKPNPALSVMEYQVVQWRSAGLSCADIAHKTDSYIGTVEEIEARAFAKTGLCDPQEVLRAVQERGQAPKYIRANSCRLDRPEKANVKL